MATMPFTPCDTTPCSDVTVKILEYVFGPVVTNLTVGSDPSASGISPVVNVIATMMGFFNSGVLTVATLIVSFITVMGVINTANDGEAFGRNWSSLWTPVRIVAGAAVLLPTGTGYSFIQLLVMMFSLWAVGFANGTFKLGVENGIINGSLQNVSQQIGIGSNATANKDYPLYNLREFASDYMASAYCAQTVNDIYAAGAVTGTNSPDIRPRRDGQPDRIATEAGIKTIRTYEFKDRNTTGALAGGNAVCGTINLYEYEHRNPAPIDRSGPLSSYVFDDAARNANNEAISIIRDAVLVAKLTAVRSMMTQIDSWVATWPNDVGGDWSRVNVYEFNQIVMRAQSSMLTDLQASMASDPTLATMMRRFTNDITKDGWAMAGGFYQRLGGLRDEFRKIYAESPGNITAPALRWLPNDAKGDLARNSAIMPAVITRKALDGSGYTPVSITDTGNVRSIIPVDLDDVDIDQMGARGNKVMNSLVGKLMESVTNAAIGADGNVDAMARIKSTGDMLAIANGTITGTVNLLDAAVTAKRAIAGGTAATPLLGGLSKVADVLGEFVTRMIIEPLQKIATWLDVLAFYFGVFLPSLPYTIFIIAVVGWILAVLQTVFAAPLWAVMHMTPDRTFIGSQTQGYLMLLSLFMRPVLIIAALFAAMLLANPIILYVSKAFWTMRTANVSSSESIGFLVQFLTFKNWLIMYGFVLLPVVYMIYGLTQALPDAILTWIGAGIKPLGETQATSEMRAGMERFGHSPRSTAPASRRPLPQNQRAALGGGGGALPHESGDTARSNQTLSETGQARQGTTPDHVPGEGNKRTAGTAGEQGSTPQGSNGLFSSGAGAFAAGAQYGAAAEAAARSGGSPAKRGGPVSRAASAVKGALTGDPGAVTTDNLMSDTGSPVHHGHADFVQNRSASAPPTAPAAPAAPAASTRPMAQAEQPAGSSGADRPLDSVRGAPTETKLDAADSDSGNDKPLDRVA